MGTNHTHSIYRELADGSEVTITLGLVRQPGCPAGPEGPAEEPTFEILSATDKCGNELELTSAETSSVESGLEGEIDEMILSENDARTEDAWDNRHDV